MTFLKKLGQVIAKGLEIVAQFGPVVTQVLPGSSGPVQVVSQDLSQIANIVVSVEAIGAAVGTAGPDKLKMAAPLVANVLLQSSVLVNHKIEQPALFQQAATEFAQATVDLLNSLKADVQTVDKTA